ncbi:Cyclic Amp-Dependent Transcription Factor Atf-6 Alpha [Manis pentadactyla]|nr:Cyclic Amp-Dependent Transcription Factor Atf-6 Alpha [Manis pentadactyla]
MSGKTALQHSENITGAKGGMPRLREGGSVETFTLEHFNCTGTKFYANPSHTLCHLIFTSALKVHTSEDAVIDKNSSHTYEYSQSWDSDGPAETECLPLALQPAQEHVPKEHIPPGPSFRINSKQSIWMAVTSRNLTSACAGQEKGPRIRQEKPGITFLLQDLLMQ